MGKITKNIFSSIILTVFLLSFSLQVVQASDVEKQLYVEDTYKYFSEYERNMIENEIKKLPEVYKVIVMPTVRGSIESTGKAFFQYRKLSQDTILILLLTDDKKIFITTGKALQKKGLDELFFKQEIEKYFVQTVKTNTVAESLIALLDGISRDIPKSIVKENKNTPKLPAPPENVLLATEDKHLWNTTTLLGVVGIGSIVALGLYYYSRKYYVNKK